MFSIYDILQEADGDENQTNDAPAAANANADNANQQNQNNDNQQGDNNPAGNDNNADDDFNMDMSLEGDDDAGGGDEGGDDTGDIDAGTTDMGTGTEEEPVEANTDMFEALSAEEQRMKISELKNQYTQLYNSCDDLIEKISNIENTEASVAPSSKLINTLTDLKKYITDYFYNQFDSVSYYENDVKLNYLLSIFYSVRDVLEAIYKLNRKNGEDFEGNDRT